MSLEGLELNDRKKPKTQKSMPILVRKIPNLISHQEKSILKPPEGTI